MNSNDGILRVTCQVLSSNSLLTKRKIISNVSLDFWSNKSDDQNQATSLTMKIVHQGLLNPHTSLFMVTSMSSFSILIKTQTRLITWRALIARKRCMRQIKMNTNVKIVKSHIRTVNLCIC